jgi:hypothetical protein
MARQPRLDPNPGLRDPNRVGQIFARTRLREQRLQQAIQQRRQQQFQQQFVLQGLLKAFADSLNQGGGNTGAKKASAPKKPTSAR